MKLQSELENVHAHELPDRVRMTHPLPPEDGTLVYSDQSAPIVKIDACGKRIWMIDRLYHHSIERSNEGGVWAPVNIEPQTVPGFDKQFEYNGIVHILNDGKETFEVSLAQVLIDNNLGYLA